MWKNNTNGTFAQMIVPQINSKSCLTTQFGNTFWAFLYFVVTERNLSWYTRLFQIRISLNLIASLINRMIWQDCYVNVINVWIMNITSFLIEWTKIQITQHHHVIQ